MTAILSSCGRYRYRLERQTPGDGTTVVVMVNPSTADATQDDATIRKLCGFGFRHRWGRIVVGNLFAQRSTDVRQLGRAGIPAVGPENDHHLQTMFGEADRLIFAWGPMSKLPKPLRERSRVVDNMAGAVAVPRPHSIGRPALDGHPRHPLMLAYAEPLLPWAFPQ